MDYGGHLHSTSLPHLKAKGEWWFAHISLSFRSHFARIGLTSRSHRARTELTNAYCLATVPCKYNCNFIIGNSLRVHQRELRDGRRRALNIPRALVLALALALALASP